MKRSKVISVVVIFLVIIIAVSSVFMPREIIYADDVLEPYTDDLIGWLYDMAKRNNIVAYGRYAKDKTYEYIDGGNEDLQGFANGILEDYLTGIEYNYSTGIDAIKNTFNSLSSAAQGNIFNFFNQYKNEDVFVSPEIQDMLHINDFNKSLNNSDVVSFTGGGGQTDGGGASRQFAYKNNAGVWYCAMTPSELVEYSMSASPFIPGGNISYNTSNYGQWRSNLYNLLSNRVGYYVYFSDVSYGSSRTVIGIISKSDFVTSRLYRYSSLNGCVTHVGFYTKDISLKGSRLDYFYTYLSGLQIHSIIDESSLIGFEPYVYNSFYPIFSLNSTGIVPYTYNDLSDNGYDINGEARILILPESADGLNENINNFYNESEDFFLNKEIIEKYYNNEYITSVNETENYHEYVTNNVYNDNTKIEENKTYTEIINNYVYNNTYVNENITVINEIPDYFVPDGTDPAEPTLPPEPTKPPEGETNPDSEWDFDDSDMDGWSLLDFLKKIISFIKSLFNILDYLNPFSDKFFLKIAFIPSNDFIELEIFSIKSLFNEKVPFMGQIIEVAEEITFIFNSGIDSPSADGGQGAAVTYSVSAYSTSDIIPKFEMTLPEKYGGVTVSIIDLTFFDSYKPFIHSLMMCVSGYLFARKILKKLPAIIHS